MEKQLTFRELNEVLERHLNLSESNEYKLTIITDRNRDANGELTKESFKAKNDLDALLYVFKKYDLQNGGMFNGQYEDSDFDEEDLALKQTILNCQKRKEVQKGVKLLTNLYFDNFDISDYYDNIVSLEAPDGHIVIKDEIDITDWDADENEEDDYVDLEADDMPYSNLRKTTKEFLKKHDVHGLWAVVGPFMNMLDEQEQKYDIKEPIAQIIIPDEILKKYFPQDMPIIKQILEFNYGCFILYKDTLYYKIATQGRGSNYEVENGKQYEWIK